MRPLCISHNTDEQFLAYILTNFQVTGLSEIRLDKEYAYLGSPAQRKMFRIKREFLK